MKKDAKPRAMPNSLNFRWSEKDILDKMPARYEAAAKQCGFSLTGATLAMIRNFTEEIEKHGCPTIRKSVERTIQKLPTKPVKQKQ